MIKGPYIDSLLQGYAQQGDFDNASLTSTPEPSSLILVLKGIDSRRLAPHGAGPYAPIASNATDGGRAHNRSVELVAQPIIAHLI
jgi:hypothetical protein